MKEGYKVTGLGDIPKSWEVLSLSRFTDEITDYVAAGSFEALRENVSVYDSQNYALYVRLTDLRKGLNKAERFVDEKSYNFLRKSNLYGREILIANIGANVGEVFLMPAIDAKATIAPNMIVIRADNGKVDPIYLYSYLASEIGRGQMKRIIAGSGHPKLNKTELRQLLAIVPPLPEQKKIASILSTVDEKIEVIDAQISQTQELKIGLMQQLLSKGIGHTKFKSSELGDIPESWEVVKLAQVTAKIGDGLHSTPKYVHKSDYYFINGNNLVNGRIFVSEKTKCIDKLEFQRHKLTLSSSTVLMSINGTIGNIAYYRGEQVVLGKSAAYITCDSALNKDFLYYLLQCELIKKYYKNELTGSTISNLSLRSIRQTPIPLPSLDEQTCIANILCNTDDKLSSLQSLKESYQQLKKGLMQQLLTGKIRVNTTHNEPALA